MTEVSDATRSGSGTPRGIRGTSLTASSTCGHGHEANTPRKPQPFDGVKVRVVLPRALAEQIDVLSRERWMTPQEWIRWALDQGCAREGQEWAQVANLTPTQWWKDRLERLRAARRERRGV